MFEILHAVMNYATRFLKSCLVYFVSKSFYKTNRFHVTMRLFDISRDMGIWKCGNISLECQKLMKKKQVKQ